MDGNEVKRQVLNQEFSKFQDVVAFAESIGDGKGEYRGCGVEHATEGDRHRITVSKVGMPDFKGPYVIIQYLSDGEPTDVNYQWEHEENGEQGEHYAELGRVMKLYEGKYGLFSPYLEGSELDYEREYREDGFENYPIMEYAQKILDDCKETGGTSKKYGDFSKAMEEMNGLLADLDINRGNVQTKDVDRVSILKGKIEERDELEKQLATERNDVELLKTGREEQK